MLRIILIILGSLFFLFGSIGIMIPGLPTTPFYILAAFCFLKSSKKLYNKVILNKYFGKKVESFIIHRALSIQTKVYSLLLMWIIISFSCFVCIENYTIKIVILSCGIIGSIVLISLKTLKN